MPSEHIKSLLDSSSGRELKEYLIAKTLELRDISNIKEFATTAAQALEVKAQLRAYHKLLEIMEGIMSFTEEGRIKSELDSYEVL